LTSAEYATLETLAKADGHAVSRDRLSEAALRRPWRAEDRSVDQLVFNLRQKLPSDGDRGSLIQSVRGSGYWMRAPDRPAYKVVGLGAVGRAGSAGATGYARAVTA
jgi:DNA-binding response OmpR family regulator